MAASAVNTQGLLAQAKKRPTAAAIDPYQGNLMTNFNADDPGIEKKQWAPGVSLPNGGSTLGHDETVYNYRVGAGFNSNDADVRGAQEAYNEAMHPNAGTSGAEKLALYNVYLSHINQKNALADEIHSNTQQRQTALSDVYGESARALDKGLKKTKENYSSRGLLYSGLREGGEAGLKGAIGAKLAGDVAGTNREYANSLTKAQQAYASIGMANNKEMMDLANQAFEVSNQNRIARMQAYQQFGQGVGQMAGTIYGGYRSSPSATAPQAAGPSGPSYYDSTATGNQYDYSGNNSGLLSA